MSSEQPAPGRNRSGDLGSWGSRRSAWCSATSARARSIPLKTVLDYTGPHPDPAATLGALSLILWTLLLITTVKYVNIAHAGAPTGDNFLPALPRAAADAAIEI